MTFGEFIKEKRLALNLSLRAFCQLAGIDPSNWSKIERGKLNPPDRGKLEEIAKLLKLKKGDKDWLKFFDLAFIAQGIIPKDVYENKEIIAALPIFFRTARGEKPDKRELDKVIKILKRR